MQGQERETADASGFSSKIAALEARIAAVEATRREERRKRREAAETEFAVLLDSEEAVASLVSRAEAAEAGAESDDARALREEVAARKHELIRILGEDPTVRLLAERAASATKAQAKAASATRLADFVARTTAARDAAALERVLDDLASEDGVLGASDALAFVHACERRAFEIHVPTSESVVDLGRRARAADGDDGAPFVRWAEYRRAARDLESALSEVEQAAILLESRASYAPRRESWARLRLIACQAKQLQAAAPEFAATRSTAFAGVFGRLGRVRKEFLRQEPFIPELQQSYAGDFAATIEAMQAEIDAAAPAPEARARPASPPSAPVGVAGRAHAASEVLGALYRATTSYLTVEAGSRAAAAEALRRITKEALDGSVAVTRVAEIVFPAAECFDDGADFRTLRRRMRPDEAELDASGSEDAEPEDPAADGAASHPAVAAASHLTKGRRALIVGAAPREERRVAIQRAFELAELEWIPWERNRGGTEISRLGDVLRGRGRRPDVVWCLVGFSAHAVSEELLKAGREHGVPVFLVPRGYGVVGLAQALVHPPRGRRAG